jgi:hypothetical protein
MLGPVLLLALSLPQIEAPPNARERLEALLESTNRLEHFHAEFAIDTGTDMGMGHVWIDFRAPGSILMRVETPVGSMSMGCSGDLLWMHSEAEGEPAQEGRLDFLDRSGPCADAAAILREAFWNSSKGPDVFLKLDWSLDTELDKHDFEISVGRAIVSLGSSAGLLGWLTTMKKLDGELTLEGDELVHRSPRAEARVDADTGFLKRLTLVSAGGERLSYELTTLELEAAPDEQLFAIPDPDPSAKDLSEVMHRGLMSRQHLRKHALDHVNRAMGGEEGRVDSEVHAELQRFLTALYDPMITERWAAWLEESQRWSREYTDSLRAELQSGASKDDLDVAAQEKRVVMAAQLDQARATLLEGVPADSGQDADATHWRAIRELENEVLDARFDALVAKPMLDDFDARVDAALDG